jgi:hypothetical protein
VSILPAHAKRWKEVTHRLPLKTDAKDALGITDLTAHGHFVSFPFLAPPTPSYAICSPPARSSRRFGAA